MFWRSGECLRVLPEFFHKAHDTIDLAGDAVIRDNGLAAIIQLLDLRRSPLRAVPVASGLLLLVDFLALGGEVVEICLLAFLKRPIIVGGRGRPSGIAGRATADLIVAEGGCYG